MCETAIRKLIAENVNNLDPDTRLDFLVFLIAREIDTEYSDREATLKEASAHMRTIWSEVDRRSKYPIHRGLH